MRFFKPYLIFFVLSPFFVVIEGCSSPPQLAKVQNGKKQPVNNPDWIQEKQALYNQEVANRALQASQLRQPDVVNKPPPRQASDDSEASKMPAKEVTDHFAVPFAKMRSPLIQQGKVELDKVAALALASGGKIHVFGRSDTILYKEGKLAQIPQNRANNIRDYLVQKGVPIRFISLSIAP